MFSIISIGMQEDLLYCQQSEDSLTSTREARAVDTCVANKVGTVLQVHVRLGLLTHTCVANKVGTVLQVHVRLGLLTHVLPTKWGQSYKYT